MKQINNTLHHLLSLAFFFSLWGISMTASAANLTEGSYTYMVKDGKATILYYTGGNSEFMMIPSILGGYPVTTLGNGMETVMSNNKADSVVLFPDSIARINRRAIYDFNDTYFFTIPATVTEIDDGATSSIADAVICGVKGSAAEAYADQIGVGFSMDVVTLKATAGKGGTMTNSGTYLIPKRLKKAYTVTYIIKANKGGRIAALTVDGADVKEAISLESYTLNYTVQAVNTGDMSIHVAFTGDTAAEPEAQAGTQH
jgi:hypothetical protein